MMGKILFSQVCACPHPGGGGVYPSLRFFPRSLVPGPLWGTPVPGSFSGHWSQVLWGVPQSSPGGTQYGGTQHEVDPGTVRMGYPTGLDLVPFPRT